MKINNMDKEIYKDFITYLKNNNIELSSCGCCGGIGIDINGNNYNKLMWICNNEEIEQNLEELIKGGENND